MTPFLSLSGVTKRFGGLLAVDHVDFDVPAGEVTAVIGPNGAGKTTLFNMIAGAQALSEGSIRFGGRDISGLAPAQRAAAGLVRTFQLVKLFKEVSVLENVKVGCHLGTRGGLLAALLPTRSILRMEREVDARARGLLARVGLSDVADAPASALPYGQQRLLEMARALAARPKLLLLDEPAAGLDKTESARLSALVRAICQEGVSVLLIEHDMRLVMDTADSVVVVDFGRKIAHGTPDAVRGDPAVLAAYLG